MQSKAQNKMATEPIAPLMFRIGLPIVLSMMLQAAYNIVDSAYLSNMSEAGEEALTALGLSFPVQLFMIAVAVGTGVGTNALAAKCLGQNDTEKVNAAVGNSVFLGIVISVLFCLFGVFGVAPYVNSQNTSGSIDPVVLAMARDYLRINCCVSFGIVFFSIFEKVLQATGRSLYSTIAQVTGAVINIVLDPVLIYGWLGCPKMGVRGAAWATVIGQIASAAIAIYFHLKKNVEIQNSLACLRPRLRVIGQIYTIGLPAIISQALLTVMTYGLNLILSAMPEVGQNAVTVYGLYCKIQQLVIFAAVGMRDVITPVVSFNYGARNKARIKQGIRCGLGYTAVLMIVSLVLIELFAEPLTGFFSLSGVTYRMCVECMRIISTGFLFAGLCVAFQGVFQALECGVESLIISIGRQVVFVLPVAWVLAQRVTCAEDSAQVWWSFLVGEVLTMAVALLMFRRAAKNKIAPIPEPAGVRELRPVTVS